jgi:hypothetical protein
MKFIIKNVIYNTEMAVLLAKGDTATMVGTEELYRAKNSKYLLVECCQFSGEQKATVLDVRQAIEKYNCLNKRVLDVKDAFPGVEFEEA